MGVTLRDKWELLQACMSAPNLSQSAKLAFGRLLGHHNIGTGQCNPSYATLARGIGVSRRTMIDAVEALEADGWIKTHERKGPKGHTSNDFSFNWSRVPSAKNRTRGVQEMAPPSAEIRTTPSAEIRTQTLEPLNTETNTDLSPVDTEAEEDAEPEIEIRKERLGSFLYFRGRKRCEVHEKTRATQRTRESLEHGLMIELEHGERRFYYCIQRRTYVLANEKPCFLDGTTQEERKAMFEQIKANRT